MAKLVMEEAQEFAVFPQDTILRVKIETVKIEDRQGGRSGTWQALNFTFKILDVIASGDETVASKEDLMAEIGGTIYGSCSARFSDSPQNKLKLWVEAIFDMPLEVGFELDTDLLVGRQCKAVTAQYEKTKFTDPVTGLPAKGHKVESLLPLGRAGAVPVARPAVPVDPWGASAKSDPWGEPPPF